VWFLEREAALAAPAAKPPGLNDRPAIALVGCGGMGRGDAGNAQRFGDIVAVCDVDEATSTRRLSSSPRTAKCPRSTAISGR